MRQFTVYVTQAELDQITSIVVGRNELQEACDVCRLLGLPFDRFQGATLYFRVVPVLRRRIEVRRER